MDMDDTLCDTRGGDERAVRDFAAFIDREHRGEIPGLEAAGRYLEGIYSWRSDAARAKRISVHADERGRRLELLKIELEAYPGGRKLRDRDFDRYEKTFMDLRMLHYDFFPGVPESIDRLRRQYCLAVVTNGPVYSQHPKLAKLAMRSRMDHVLIEGELPWGKPCPEIFALACERCGCRADEAVHIGDSLEADVAGALAGGIRSVWISRGEPLPAGTAARPDHIVRDFLEAERLLETLR